MHLYGDYLSIGGMPAAVAEYVRSNSFLAVRELQDNIITAYIADMSKYAGGQTPSIRTAFMTVPSQLAKPNPKFQYAIIPWK